MKTLISVRSNVILGEVVDNETEENSLMAYHEIVFLSDKVKYDITNERDIMRSREVEEKRVIVSNEQIDLLINALQEMKENGNKLMSKY